MAARKTDAKSVKKPNRHGAPSEAAPGSASEPDADLTDSEWEDISPAFTRDENVMLYAEHGYVMHRRKEKLRRRLEQGKDAPSMEHPVIGLALSGGGVRSASFSIGVMQGLHEKHVMDKLDYISTVSGGGYAGSSLTWFMSQHKYGKTCDDEAESGRLANAWNAATDKAGSAVTSVKSGWHQLMTGYAPPAREKRRHYGTQPENFPFCEDMALEDRKEAGPKPKAEYGASYSGSRTIIDFIRQRSSYLEPGSGLSKLSALTVVLRGTFISVCAYLFLFSLIFAALSLSRFHEDFSIGEMFPFLPWDAPLFAGIEAIFKGAEIAGFFWLAIAIQAIALVGAVAYSLFSAQRIQNQAAYGWRRTFQAMGGFLLSLMIALIIIGLLDLIYDARFSDITRPGEQWSKWFAGGTAATGTIGGLLYNYLKNRFQALAGTLSLSAIAVISSLLMAFGFGILAMALGHWLMQASEPAQIGYLLFGALFCIFANINNSGLHRMYRDRLMETFMPDIDSVYNDKIAARSSADRVKVYDMCGADVDGPYHIVNTNAVMVTSKQSKLRSRGGDSFVFAPLYSGSRSTGWVKSERWLTKRTGWLGFLKEMMPWQQVGPMTLPTAMAISGAAVNPRTGADGKGMTKGTAISFILGMLNLRLGYWMPSPGRDSVWRWLSRFHPPNFISPGLVQGLLGRNHNENSGWNELTDGGHYDNTGIYELIRRRVKTIILVDGSADPDVDFASFANAAEKCFIDFDTHIRFFDGEDDAPFHRMMRDTGVDPDNPVDRIFRFSKNGFAFARIEYPDGEFGYLFYIKSSMVRNLPATLFAYRRANESYPHEPTSDQFFSEQQFEAYRALGSALADQMVRQAEKFTVLAEALDLDIETTNRGKWPTGLMETESHDLLGQSKGS